MGKLRGWVLNCRNAGNAELKRKDAPLGETRRKLERKLKGQKGTEKFGKELARAKNARRQT